MEHLTRHRKVGDAKPFISLLDALWPQWKQGTEMPFDIRTDYILESAFRRQLRTTALGENAGCQEDISGATIVTDAPEQVEKRILLDSNYPDAEWRLGTSTASGSLTVFTPKIGFDEMTA